MAASYVNKVLGYLGYGNALTLASVPGSTGSKIVLLVAHRYNTAFSTSPAYGATPLTQVGSAYYADSIRRTIWYLDAPSGTQDITMAWGSNVEWIAAVAFVLSGAGAAGTPAYSSVVSGTSMSATVSSETGGICLDLALEIGVAGPLTPDAGQQNAGETGGSTVRVAASTEPGAASVAMGWSWTGAASGVNVVVPIASDGGSPADATAPTLTARVIDAAGTSLTLTADEAITAGVGGNGGMALSASGGAASLTYASGGGTTSVVYTIGRAIQSGETVTLAYTQPGNGWEDAAGNDLASFSGAAVTNNSTQGAVTFKAAWARGSNAVLQ
jgi:hypothetical protein